jgi:Demethylmenaquinone methyltransferase
MTVEERRDMKDETLAAKTARLGCATLVDAIGQVHSHRVPVPSMASPDPSRTLFGRAATISFMPYREDLVEPGRDFAYFFYGALGGRAPTPGQVLVLSSGGYPDVSHGGGTKLSRGDGHGAGVLADGRLRDFDQLRGYSFATWCRGEAVPRGGDAVMPHDFGITVEISGVCVNPGDYVYMDNAGGVVIPSASLHRVIDIAEEVTAEEAVAAKSIRVEATRPDK